MKRILLQVDTDRHPSVFDRVVALDAGADEVLSYGGVTPEDVPALVHGLMFTRGPGDLRNSAVFIGGSSVQAGETLLQRVRATLFEPLTVSVMIDSGGSNTTAAAAVLAARSALDVSQATTLVLGGTGPVGQRVALLLSREGAAVRLGSRSVDRAAQVCERIAQASGREITPVATGTREQRRAALSGAELVVAAGAAGIELLPASERRACKTLRVAIDLNAVPPAGIEGVKATDKGTELEGVRAYGAIAVGGTKMKIHKAAVARLFESNDQVLDAEQIYALGAAAARG